MIILKGFSIKNQTRNLIFAGVISAFVLISAAASNAQNINDDLKPKPTAAKVKTPAKPAKKNSKPASRSPIKSSGAKNKNAVTYYNSAETPDRIINRFMDFRQTTSVTNRDWKTVLNQTEKNLKANPNNATANAQMLIAQGQLALNRRDFPAAIASFKSALQILPASSLPNYCLGKAYLANGQAAAAENSFKEAADQNKDFALAYKGIGDALAAQGKKKDSAKYVKKATETAVRQGTYVP